MHEKILQSKVLAPVTDCFSNRIPYAVIIGSAKRHIPGL